MIVIFKTVTGIYHYCNMSEASRPFVVNKCMYVCILVEIRDFSHTPAFDALVRGGRRNNITFYLV